MIGTSFDYVFGRQISFHTNHIYRVYPDRMGLPRTQRAPEHPPGVPGPHIPTHGVHAVGIFGLGFLTPEISAQPPTGSPWWIQEKFHHFENPVLIFIYRLRLNFSAKSVTFDHLNENPVLIFETTFFVQKFGFASLLTS